jgi:hypothetical protein
MNGLRDHSVVSLAKLEDFWSNILETLLEVNF